MRPPAAETPVCVRARTGRQDGSAELAERPRHKTKRASRGSLASTLIERRYSAALTGADSCLGSCLRCLRDFEAGMADGNSRGCGDGGLDGLDRAVVGENVLSNEIVGP